MNGTNKPRLAVIGAGWAGLAAAVLAAQRGWNVTVFEAARTPGGRARSVPVSPAGGVPLVLDNGQHILIGAYRHALDVMRTVGGDPARSLRRLPLDLRDARGEGLALPNWPWQSLAGAVGVLRARGWPLAERWALLRALQAWQRSGFACDAALSVAQLCRHLPARVHQRLIEPLCTAALNTPTEQASAQVFLRVLQESFHGGAGSADLLLPTVPLGALLAVPACAWLAQQGAQVRLGVRVGQIARGRSDDGGVWRVDDEGFDALVLATPAPEAARLLQTLAPAWAECAAALQHEPIGTVYLQIHTQTPTSTSTQNGPLLTRPMLASHAGAAQFVFDRQDLSGDAGVTAWVSSTLRLDKTSLEHAVLTQAVSESASRGFLRQGTPTHWQLLGTIVEKRATFACTVGLQRPAAHIPGLDGLAVCGDYVQGPYPATLEGAVRSGQQAVALLAGGDRPDG